MWNTIPTYEQLSTTLGICWKYFFKPKESKAGIRNAKQLATMALQYNRERSLRYLIAKSVSYWRSTNLSENAAVQKASGIRSLRKSQLV